jgi:putative membrane protein insertion efficiency factor
MQDDRGAGCAPQSPAAAALALVLRGLIRAYQLLIAPVLPPSCRYYPSCSHYAAEAVALHGPWHGSRLALHRLLRCHPWGGGGYDPVPLDLGR